jgi:hypothetical protein
MPAESSRSTLRIGLLAMVILVSAACIVYFDAFYPSIKIDRSLLLQAFFITNGQVFFGHVSGLRRGSVTLDDVYYIQTQVNPQTQERKNILLRRGKEWHQPTEMTINFQQILWVEPVGSDSEVAKLVAKLRSDEKPK